MSAQPIVSPDSRHQESRSSQQRRLRVVRRRPRRLATVPFVIVLGAILAAGMIGLLLLNTTLQNQAFEASQLKRRATEMTYAEVELQQRVVEASSTKELARKASEQGLRPNYFVGFVVLPDGKVVGNPKPADPFYLPAAVTRTDAEMAQMRTDRARENAAKRQKSEQATLERNRQQLLDARAKEQAAKDQAAKDQAAREQAVRTPNPAPTNPAPTRPQGAR